jgi:hypothetical protein
MAIEWYKTPETMSVCTFVRRLVEYATPFFFLGVIVSAGIVVGNFAHDNVASPLGLIADFLFPTGLDISTDLLEIYKEHQAPKTLAYVLIIYALLVVINLAVYGAHKTSPSKLHKYVVSPFFLFGFMIGSAMFGSLIGLAIFAWVTDGFARSLGFIIFSLIFIVYLTLLVYMGRLASQSVWVDYDPWVCRIAAIFSIPLSLLLNRAWEKIVALVNYIIHILT